MLSQQIRALRLAKGITQTQLADRLGVTKQSVSNWENDNIQPSAEMVVRLAEVFSVSTDYLLGLREKERLDVSGLSRDKVAHLRMLVEDLRERDLEK